ncbi:AI-2E family transporter [Clostridiaceae bacterium M8S5]|nr:AI-2E family transporter [Clostridiaceae bacterium M8S5]
MDNKKIKIPYLNIVPVAVIIMLLYKIVNNDNVAPMFYKIINPFLGGFLIAYILNPFIRMLEKKLKCKRVLSITISYLLVLGLVIFIIIIAVPKIYNNFVELAKNLPDFINEMRDFLKNDINNIELLQKYNIAEYIDNAIANLGKTGNIAKLMDYAGQGIGSIASTALGFTHVMFNLMVNSIIAIFLLYNKEDFVKGLKRMLFAFMDNKNANKTLAIYKEIDDTFSRFLIGKILDSAIIGVICFVLLLITGNPYALILSTIVGITNMIPYFGPFIGAGPAILITLFVSPIKALWTALIILGLQQFDGWILGPKILGDQVGIKPFWIITGILIGGALFGLVGMFIGAPLIAVIKIFIERIIKRRLDSKGMADM